jgi:hypothetical protein
MMHCHVAGCWSLHTSDFLIGAFMTQANAMGGNVVYVLTHRAGQTGTFYSTGGKISQTNVTLSGSVYDCPED